MARFSIEPGICYTGDRLQYEDIARLCFERCRESRGNILDEQTDRAVSQPNASKPEGRILPFRPRGSLLTRNAPQPPSAAVPDLEKYERAPDEPDDFRHRMAMNALGLGVTIALIVSGLWIAEVMAHMRKNQDCVLTGRSNCAQVEAPVSER
jgi:hypothetical protein